LNITLSGLNETDIEKLWLVVSPQNPHKQENSLLNEYQRLHLAKLATEHDERIRVTDIEFTLPRPSYTIDTLTYLSEKHPQHEFSILMGADSFQNLPKWKNANQLVGQLSSFCLSSTRFFNQQHNRRSTKLH